ncbi:hypothetical protein C1I98_36130 [Spongiactinospora gelatinilytica]|uniref:histidine kinase n=1 Tax=Spongiactinospora gelatinilytica TaxID=2666298 RepID=A0A2W2FG23_9ACTN|nr:HAMP domain-containing sensor histidine kinase [Spongiactinospora gelatinilytica]PZG23648.1 hypothetical protein C1I98_36130 [Spongiactinospora gelatinilytica]
MIRPLRSLRARLAVLGFLAIYLPLLLLSGVVLVTETETATEIVNGAEQVADVTSHTTVSVTWTLVALGPAAAAAAWWWAGRAVRPIERVRAVADEIGATDLSRRIGLSRGPVEVTALAASFDAMLDRLERAAATQRRLIEETSHELRIPLSVLLANADVLLAHPAPTLRVYREGLERSRAAAVRLRTVIDDLLAEARGRARVLDRRPADLMALVRDVVAGAAPLAAGKDIDVSVAGPDAVECAVDGPTVGRAVANLVDNAIRYGPPGSSVEIEVGASGREAVVTVTDHGAGVPAGERERIFQRFWRGRRDVPGTGLGLPIARQVARAHGGDLTVCSPGPAGDGCVFRLTLRR